MWSTRTYIILFLVTLVVLVMTRTTLMGKSAPNLVKPEKFNNYWSRRSLVLYPYVCPFEYITFEEHSELTTEKNRIYLVKSKLKDNPTEFINVYNNIDEFLTKWDEMVAYYPNLAKCGNPYDNLYKPGSYDVMNRIESTTPLYEHFQEAKNDTDEKKTNIWAQPVLFQSERRPPAPRQPSTQAPSAPPATVQVNEFKKMELPSIYSARDTPIKINPVIRNDNNSDVKATYFADPDSPNVPQTGHEQIDTSVTQVNVKIPPTYTEDSIQKMKNDIIRTQFDQKHEYEKVLLTMNNEIERLQNEISVLRESLIGEKNNFENLNSTIEQKQDHIDRLLSINKLLETKIVKLEQKYKELENMYLKADSYRASCNTRLRNIRKTIEEQSKNPGFTYLPPTDWTVAGPRPPVCLPQKECPVCPVDVATSDRYMVLSKSDEKTILPNFQKGVIYDGRYYKKNN